MTKEKQNDDEIDQSLTVNKRNVIATSRNAYFIDNLCMRRTRNGP